jgi:hypothetical protein
MKIEDILELWKEDANVDRTELGDEALKIPKLHHKYYQIYISEKLTLRSYETVFVRKLPAETIEATDDLRMVPVAF